MHEVGDSLQQGNLCSFTLWSLSPWAMNCSAITFCFTQGLPGFLEHMDKSHFFTVRTGMEWASAEESSLSCLVTESPFCAGDIPSSEPLRLKRYFINLCSEIDNECQLVPGGTFVAVAEIPSQIETVMAAGECCHGWALQVFCKTMALPWLNVRAAVKLWVALFGLHADFFHVWCAWVSFL